MADSLHDLAPALVPFLALLVGLFVGRLLAIKPEKGEKGDVGEPGMTGPMGMPGERGLPGELLPHTHRIEDIEGLAEAGLIAPAPLREEWAAAWEGHGATRIGSAQESPEDIEGVPPGGWVVHRYVSDWLPVDSDEGDGSDDR